MNQLARCLVSATIFLWLAATAAAQDQISVDVTSVVADVSRKPIGINVNFLLDDDANRAAAIDRLADALRKAGVKYLRYPGGEKSDGYLWSVPPFEQSQPTLARWAPGDYPQNQEWPSFDRQLVEADGRTFKIAPLDFDEFMTLCREISCVPTIVICYDSMYKPAQAGGVAPTRDQLLDTAREWVRYANITKGYQVRHWEIGNESYLPQYNGSATAANYARDLIDFSRAMKAVDPTIRIGANGESDAWWKTILTSASSAIDFLAVHNYPATNWGSFAYYQANNVNLMSVVQTAQNAINAYAPVTDRARLTVAATEVNSPDWSGAWPHLNDLGHALVLFDLVGSHLANPKVEFTQLWNTRWLANDTATTPSLWDAFDKQNQLQATGRAMAIWGQFLKEKLVRSTSTASVRSYAAYSPASGKLTVFLINKDAVARPVSVTLNIPSAAFSTATWVFSGASPQDLYPKWTQQAQSWNAGNLFPITLAPVSVTVLDITPDARVYAMPGLIQAEDFREGGYWDATAGNTGGAYRATNVDVQATSDTGGGFNVGWISAGEWLEYTIRVDKAGYYDVAARVASPYAGKALRLSVDGQDVAGTVTIPSTAGWQKWQTLTHRNVYVSAGTHRVKIVAVTDGFNLNWLALTSAAGRTHAIPGVVQAEDFDDGAYWDSTVGNSGAAYRTTDVDIQATGDAGGGFNIGWIAAGEWLEYTVEVGTAGGYDVSARVASPYADKSFQLLVDGVDVSGRVIVPNTGSYQRWQTVTRTGVRLTAGTHRLRFVANTSGFNLNWIRVDASQ